MAPFTITRSTLDEEFTFTGSFDITGLLDACQNPASFQKRSPKLDNIPLHFSLKKEEGGDSLKVFLHDPSRSSELYDCEVTLRAWDGSVVESLSFFSKSIREGSGRGWSSFCKISALQDFLASNDLAKIQYKITCYGHGDTTIPRPLHGIQATQRLTNLTASIFDNKDSSDALFVI
ncbi:hypothetical protein PUNSTDRAFT_53253, partial [Punctularia strigosozonata HHB-11173 SS5]|uniref:uncharacterized protein n=1 Tax=Punctularia strigosozonata (strain HHB-11173) TaxID=741275 RepID=UPI0004417BF6